MATVKIGIYGSVDAGKTSLIQNLLAVKIKKYDHEEAKSITTIIGSTSFKISKKDSKYLINSDGNGREYCVVDTPGHMTYRHRSHSSIGFIDHGFVLIEVMNMQSLAQGLKFSQIFEIYEIPYTIVITKVDGHTKTKILEFTNSVKSKIKKSKGLIYYTIRSQLARENILNYLYQLDATQKKIKNGLFFALKSYNPNRIGQKIENVTGAVVGGIGAGLKIGDTIKLHDLPSIDSATRTIVDSRIIKIIKNNTEVLEITDSSFHTIQLSICPDIAAQDGLAGCTISKSEHTGVYSLNLSVVQQYSTLKKKMQIYLLHRGLMVKAQLYCTGKKKITLKFGRPLYLVDYPTHYILYQSISGVALGVAKLTK